jgi:hypothetical protein
MVASRVERHDAAELADAMRTSSDLLVVEAGAARGVGGRDAREAQVLRAGRERDGDGAGRHAAPSIGTVGRTLRARFPAPGRGASWLGMTVTTRGRIAA